MLFKLHKSMTGPHMHLFSSVIGFKGQICFVYLNEPNVTIMNLENNKDVCFYKKHQ